MIKNADYHGYFEYTWGNTGDGLSLSDKIYDAFVQRYIERVR